MNTFRGIRRSRSRSSAVALALTVPLALALSVNHAAAQASVRDRIADLITGSTTNAPQKLAQSGTTTDTTGKTATPDPRAGDKEFQQARRLMRAIDEILADTAKNRTKANKLPSKNDFILTPLWTETREDRQDRIRALMDSALGIVTDVPIVDIQKRIETLRKNITEIENNIVLMREKQLTAPQDSLMPGVISDTVTSLGKEIVDSEKRIALNREQIETAKDEVHKGLQKSGIKLTKKQVDLLMGSVLSGDVVRLVAVFNSAKLIDQQLAKLMAASGDNMGAARKYFAMHAALFAILVHAQDTVIDKIDRQYLPKLSAIRRDLKTAQARTRKLLRGKNRPDQRRVLEANLKSQKLAADAARGYNRYLLQQREQVATARRRAAHDLSIADNTYETVEASFQLRNLMKNTRSTFEALQKLEAPTFEQIFKNEELRREFENLTRKLEVPTG
ncbi:MAG: hypothetical protein ACR2OY_00585 [Boseongicola sp.]